MGLREYHKKRDFRRTSEPRGKERRRAGRSFVIQKHAATRLHYDFRLEHDGVLKSWAVPKGPSFDPAQKRLAVQVEDHPVEYGGFEGNIPHGEYGGGAVLLWDRGTWKPEGDVDEMLRRGNLKFTLQGEKLRGSWALVRMHGREGGDENWLLLKHADAFARPPSKAEITEQRPESVKTGRSIEEIAADARSKTWRSSRATSASTTKTAFAERLRLASARGAARKQKARSKGAARGAPSRPRKTASRAKTKPTLDDAEGARATRMPAIVEPQLATLVKEVPRGSAWLHETKFDGYRALCRLAGGRVRWFTRRGLDWSAKFGSLSPAIEALPAREAWIDGEVVVVLPDGTTDFQSLQNALGLGERAELVYYAFDLLYLDGHDLRELPLASRKELLADLLRDARDPLRYSDHVVGGGERFHAAACSQALEGIVSKRADAPYRAGRRGDWVKVKCAQGQEMVIGGWTDPQGARSGLGALLLGCFDERGRLHYAGRVGTGFSAKTLLELKRKLAARERATSAYDVPPRGADARGVHWAEPELVAQVEFTGWTSDGRLRHPSFEGLREDKDAREVIRERAKPTKELADGPTRRITVPSAARPSTRAKRTKAAKRATGVKRTSRTAERERGARSAHSPRSKAKSEPSGGAVEVAGVSLTHPERLLWPDAGITKLDLARYYERVADRILPHVAERALSFVRCPDGFGGECFFQRHMQGHWPADVHTVPDASSGRTYVQIDSLQGLIALAQMSVLEIHPWGSPASDLDTPDRIVFDLDPDPGVPWKRVVDAAALVRELLERLELQTFLKTTGGKGLHVVAPLTGRNTWDDVKGFAQNVARTIARAAPKEFVATASKALRKGRIFVDWLRNARSATAVAPWSTRARERATISLPLPWSALAKLKSADEATVENAHAWLARADPWREFARVRQSLTSSALRSVERRGN